ncbi:hypothetical protein AAG906_001124 [Vitis piasezkii]
MDGMQNDISQKIDNLQYSISRLTNLNTVQEKGRFPSQPHQNPKGVHEVESHEGESSQMKDVKVGENAKKLKGSLWSEKSAKTGQKQGSTRFRSLRESSAKLALRCETVSQPKRSRCGINVSLRKRPSFAKSFRNSIDSSAKIFAAAKPILAHECHFAAQEPPFRSETAAKLQSMKIPNFAVKAPFRRVFRSCETNFGTRVPFRNIGPHFAIAKWVKNSFSCENPCCEIGLLCENQNDL